MRLAATMILVAVTTPLQAQMTSSYTIENNYISRTLAIVDGRLTTDSLGAPGNEISVCGGDEFALILGPERLRVAAKDFKVLSAQPSPVDAPDDSLTVTVESSEHGLQCEINYHLKPDDFYARKSITIRNTGDKPVQILDVEVESLQFKTASARGLGKPVFAGDLFLGLEFPLGENQEKDGLVTLLHHPARTLKPGEELTTKTAVIGVALPDESAEEAFNRYVTRIALRNPEVITQYGNWAVYDYLSDNVWPDEKLVLRTVDELADLKKLGWRPDYYLMDAGWYAADGDYTQYRKAAWPSGPQRMVDAISGLDIGYGLWFDVGGGITDNPKMAPSRSSGGRLCLASEPYISTFKNALLAQVRELGLKMVKLDFATFDCDSDKHGHLQDEYAREATMTSFLDMLDTVRRERPETKYIIFNGFHRSPWWLMHVDTIYSNDPAPSHFPSVRLRDSVNAQTDLRVHEHRFEHLLPWHTIDDCGLMIGNMGTIYWLGAEEWRKTWVMNVGRGGLMPFIYGDLSLLDKPDRQFLVKMWRVLKDNPKVFSDTRSILGKPSDGEVYGYSHFDGAHGFVFMSNPTFDRKSVTIKLDASLGLHEATSAQLRISEIFPVKCDYDGGESGFRIGSAVEIELAPFEVRALEVKRGDGIKEGLVPPRRSSQTSVSIPVQMKKSLPEEVTDAAIDMTNNALVHLASSTRIKVEPVTLTREKLAGVSGIYAGSIELPEFSAAQTLALPVRFLAEGKPHRYGDTSTRAVAAAWTGDQQVVLDITPEYGRSIWSGISWLTFHTKLGPELSGQKLKLLAIALSTPDSEITLEKVYLLGDDTAH